MPFRIATTTRQAPWECKWARAGHRLSADPGGHPEELWICVRPTAAGSRRVVSESECSLCENWEVEDEPDEQR